MDFSRFLKRMDRLESVIEHRARDLRLWLALGNPEDTGRSEASWNLNRNAPNKSQKPPDWNAPGMASVEAGEITIDGFRLGDSLHVTNTIPYVPYLERGHSQQAPNGWIGPTTRRAGEELRQDLRKLA